MGTKCTCIGSCVQGLHASRRRWGELAGTSIRWRLHVYLSNPELPELGLAWPCFLGSDSPAVLASAPPSLIWRTECSICMPRTHGLGTPKSGGKKAPQQSRGIAGSWCRDSPAPRGFRQSSQPSRLPQSHWQAAHSTCAGTSDNVSFIQLQVSCLREVNEMQQGGLTLVHALAWSFWSGQTGSCVSQPPAPLGHCLQHRISGDSDAKVSSQEWPWIHACQWTDLT